MQNDKILNNPVEDTADESELFPVNSLSRRKIKKGPQSKSIIFKVSDQDHNLIKIAATQQCISIRTFVLGAVAAEIKRLRRHNP